MIDPRSRRAVAHPLDQPTGAATAAVGRHRWWVCALLFGASTINYIDRQVLGITGSYVWVSRLRQQLYLIALACIHMLVPVIGPAATVSKPTAR